MSVCLSVCLSVCPLQKSIWPKIYGLSDIWFLRFLSNLWFLRISQIFCLSDLWSLRSLLFDLRSLISKSYLWPIFSVFLVYVYKKWCYPTITLMPQASVLMTHFTLIIWHMTLKNFAYATWHIKWISSLWTLMIWLW